MTEATPPSSPPTKTASPHWLVRLFRIVLAFCISGVVGGLAANYALHWVRLWVADGVTCAEYLPNGGVDRLYGVDCSDRP